MTLQSSGQITIDDIRTEFGDSGEIQLTDYYGAYPTLPKAGEIALSDFYDVQNIAITDVVDRNENNSGVAEIAFYTRTVGVVGNPVGGDVRARRGNPNTATIFDQWTDNGQPDDPTLWEFQIIRNSFSLNGGTAGVGALRDGVLISWGTWYTIPISTGALGAFTAQANALNVGDRADLNVTIQIREVGQTQILSESTHNLVATGWFL